MLVLHENREILGVLFMRISGTPTDEELETYIEAERKRIPTPARTKSATVMELEEVWPSKQRKRISDFQTEMEARHPNQSLGLAVVVQNSVIRGAFTAYFWISAPNYPTKMVPRAVDAWEWVSERLSAAGLPAPSRSEFERVARAHWPARQAVPGRGMVPFEPNAGRRIG